MEKMRDKSKAVMKAVHATNNEKLKDGAWCVQNMVNQVKYCASKNVGLNIIIYTSMWKRKRTNGTTLSELRDLSEPTVVSQPANIPVVFAGLWLDIE